MRMIRIAQVAAGLAAMSLGPASLLAQQAAPPQTAANNVVDGSYVATAAVGDMFEIESSRLALQRSKDRAVLDFANLMLADHSQMSAKLKAAAQPANIPVPVELDTQHKSMLKELQDTKTEAEFNRAYFAAQVKAHEEALGLHRTYARSGGQMALKQVAQEAAPVVQKHLDHLKTTKR